jgi:hypothetical protein
VTSLIEGTNKLYEKGWGLFYFLILWFFLSKPVCHWTVAGVPLMVRALQFKKPCRRRNKGILELHMDPDEQVSEVLTELLQWWKASDTQKTYLPSHRKVFTTIKVTSRQRTTTIQGRNRSFIAVTLWPEENDADERSPYVCVQMTKRVWRNTISWKRAIY